MHDAAGLNSQAGFGVQEKKRVKEEKLKNEEKYMFALVDGVKEQVHAPPLSLRVSVIHASSECQVALPSTF